MAKYLEGKICNYQEDVTFVYTEKIQNGLKRKIKNNIRWKRNHYDGKGHKFSGSILKIVVWHSLK